LISGYTHTGKGKRRENKGQVEGEERRQGYKEKRKKEEKDFSIPPASRLHDVTQRK
jgi:hypothetical protein